MKKVTYAFGETPKEESKGREKNQRRRLIENMEESARDTERKRKTAGG